jgi:hypothetical protein
VASWTDYVPSERDLLIDKVKYGELTPQEAEAEAARLGLEPFEVSPNPADFDPMKEALWSLPMALAWIMWRTPDAVREMWDLYREKFRFWFFQRWQVTGDPIYAGHFLTKKDPSGLLQVATLDLSSATPKIPDIETYVDAFRFLSNVAQGADWRASGVPTDGGPRREISPLEWVDFDLVEVKDKAGIRRAALRDRQRGALDIGYDNVLFPVLGFRKSVSAAGPSKERKRGRPPVIQWDVLKTEFLRLMTYHGDVSNDDPEWNSNERVIAALMEFYSEKGKEVSRSALQPKVDEWLEEWRRSSVARK